MVGTQVLMVVHTWPDFDVETGEEVGRDGALLRAPVSLCWCVVEQRSGALMLCSGARVTSAVRCRGCGSRRLCLGCESRVGWCDGATWRWRRVAVGAP